MDTKRSLVQALCKRVTSQFEQDEADALQCLCRAYYEDFTEDEMTARDIADLYGAAIAHWSFGRKRRPAETLVRVYNPDFDQYGWQSTHTVLEIVTDDMPFLVDSVALALNGRGLATHVAAHPVYLAERNAKGELQNLQHGESATVTGGTREAWMHFEIDRQTEASALTELSKEVAHVLDEVRVTVSDWQPMKQQLQEVVREIKGYKPRPVAKAEVDETLAFLKWMDDDHFTLLGYRGYDLLHKSGEDMLLSVAGSGLGILRESLSEHSKSFASLPDGIRQEARIPRMLILTKSNTRATVHRAAYMDYVGVKRFNEKGEVVGEHRFLGLYTSSTYNRSPRHIPCLRGKVESVMTQAGFDPQGHNGKALLNILETYPRDELFQTSSEDLHQIAIAILHLQARQRVRLFVRRDNYGRYYSCLVFVPRESYNTELRMRIESILMQELRGESAEFTAQVSESPMARIHYIVHVKPRKHVELNLEEMERQLVDATRSWVDQLKRALVEHHGEERGNALSHKYEHAFSVGYRADYSTRTAVIDTDHIEELSDTHQLSMRLYKPLAAPEGILRFKLYHRTDPVQLSDALPMLENMGVRVVSEHPYKVKTKRHDLVWVHDFRLRIGTHDCYDLAQIKTPFQQLFERVWCGEVDNDGFNSLALSARLSWREIVILRAYYKYMRQIGLPFSQAYVEQTLSGNPEIARLLVQFFKMRFDPKTRDLKQEAAISSELLSAIDTVSSLDEDRILRRFHTVIAASLRTNYFQTRAGGEPKSYFSFKLDPERIDKMPLPRPHFEIFVYATQVEGVHLRGGRVARGGLRWSDRQEDYRKEVLGLMKAQMVKNTVIVPVGAKGGFVVKEKGPDGGRPTREQGVACYQTYISGLLDITDNIVNYEIVPPVDVVRHDQDDPYLVVAADKGTATFSDIANGVSKDYGFWMGDAFASGGSVGYDHKKMGITARGAWESVKRHFREMGRDIQTEPFTVVGIGAMFGDVFGNGMLLSEQTKLVAAFSGEHIFLDPDPDPARSYKERQRLFDLEGSTWADYNTKLISKGGGVWSRNAKSIELSPEVQKLLDVSSKVMAPSELMRAMLLAPVDLFWNGGIGTYVKASWESDAEVGDRANDPVRVDGRDMRVRVVGEGGNLGLTQAGRIEYAMHGGRINTDAIDNSGGVDCSDREVNIKILLNAAVVEQDLTEKQRNELLVSMTDEVSRQVIRDNYRHTRAISVTEAQASKRFEEQAAFIRHLERSGQLNRKLEGLPDEEAIAERHRAGLGLTRPELSVLLSYAKIVLYNDLLDSDLPDDDHLSSELFGYFPAALHERFGERMQSHRLHREIIATVVTNSVINRMGPTFVFRVKEETGAPASEVARAYSAAREIFSTRPLWKEIEALDNRVSTEIQIQMMISSCRLVGRATLWILRNISSPLSVASLMERFTPGAELLSIHLKEALPARERKQLQAAARPYVRGGVPAELAKRVASLGRLFASLDVTEVASATGESLKRVASLYYALGEQLALPWLLDRINQMDVSDHWQSMARAALREDVNAVQGALTHNVINAFGDAKRIEDALSLWRSTNCGRIHHWLQMLSDFNSTGQVEIAMLSVALRELRSLARVQGATIPDECENPKVREAEQMLQKLYAG
jgi:glutamate dehydrogenase